MCSTSPNMAAKTKDLGNGFYDVGVAAPISNHRGTVATEVDGRNVVLSLIMDNRGGYALLMIDAETGKAQQFPIPFENVKGDSPYASLLSSANKFYTHYGDYFVEFDPAKPGFTFSAKTFPQMSMGMTEDDNGVIWSVSYPDSGVVAFDPKAREFRDFGSVHEENWQQYQRHMAADDAGWIYFGLGMTATQIVALDPTTSKSKALIPDAERGKTSAYVYRDKDGKVYGQAIKDESPWYELYKGVARKLEKHTPNPKPIITGSQALRHSDFPDGKKLGNLNFIERELEVVDPKTSSAKTVTFDYTSEGAILMGVNLAPDGTIYGGTAFPMRSYTYDPKTDTMENRASYGQWNTITTIKDKIFVGGYGAGFLLEWDPSKPWVPTVIGNAGSNPLFHTQVTPTIHRPHALLALADESMVIMGGTPQYGYTGGGLLFWDRKATTQTLLQDTDVIPDQSTFALEELPDGKILGGTTTSAGSGGEKKATEAELYIMDIASKKVEWHEAVIPGTQSYVDFHKRPDGLIYGIADRKTLFLFDPAKRAVVHQEPVPEEFGITVSEQGPRVFAQAPDKLYVFCEHAIAAVDPETHKLSLVAKSPVELKSGGPYHDGRLYFGTSSHVGYYQTGTGKSESPEK